VVAQDGLEGLLAFRERFAQNKTLTTINVFRDLPLSPVPTHPPPVLIRLPLLLAPTRRLQAPQVHQQVRQEQALASLVT